MMRVLVCGSRDWTDEKAVTDALGQVFLTAFLAEDPLVIIHGAARGADSMAGYWAERVGAKQEVYRPDWERHGKAAGVIRNREMVESAPVLVLAFWCNRSKGTKSTIDLAVKAGIRTVVFTPGETTWYVDGKRVRTHSH